MKYPFLIKTYISDEVNFLLNLFSILIRCFQVNTINIIYKFPSVLKLKASTTLPSARTKQFSVNNPVWYFCPLVKETFGILGLELRHFERKPSSGHQQPICNMHGNMHHWVISMRPNTPYFIILFSGFVHIRECQMQGFSKDIQGHVSANSRTKY